MTAPLTWTRFPGSEIQAPLYVAGHYVISERYQITPAWDAAADDYTEERIGRFTLSYRPPGRHVALGTFPDLESAQRTAGEHRKTSP